MSFDFPKTPANGQTYTPVGGPSYAWDGMVWTAVPESGGGGGAGAGLIVSDTPPADPVSGQLWFESDTGNTFVWYNDADSGQWVQVNIQPAPVQTVPPGLTAQTRNRIVNGAMQVSQENGDNSVANGNFPADQWTFMTGGFTPGMARFASGLGTSSGKAIYMSNTVARPSPAAGDYCMIYQPIEGTRIADFGWGTAQAKPIVVRFRALSTNAGTYSLFIRSPDSGRSYLAPFTCPAGGWNDYAFVVPGDTAGNWPTTTATGMLVSIGLATGTTYGGGVAGWQAGYKMQIAGNSNFCATASVVFYLGDVGVYLDPLGTGVAPRWEMPDEPSELLACERYWQYVGPMINSGAYGGAGANNYESSSLRTMMRIAPASAYSGIVYSNCSALQTWNTGLGTHGTQVSVTAAASYYALFGLTLNARM